MPPNTPAIYVVGALIALGGVLFGALGQIISSALQRRHERRLKLDEIRRETYAAMLANLQGIAEVRSSKSEAEAAKMEAILSEGHGLTQVAMGAVERIRQAQERHTASRHERAELRARIMLIGGTAVQGELASLMHRLVREDFKLEPGAADAFVNACRKELGAQGGVIGSDV